MDAIEARDLEHGPRRPPRAGSLLATCTRCEKLYQAPALEFNPVCSVCAADRATMRSLGMHGSYPLSVEAIDHELTRTSAGNYALGYLEDDRFVVFYVGRSDFDLRRRLQSWVGAPSRYQRYAPSGMASWSTRRSRSTPLDRPALSRVGCASDGYTHFAYSYASSPDGALEKELRNFDDFGGCGQLDNEQCPDRHAGDDPAHRL